MARSSPSLFLSSTRLRSKERKKDFSGSRGGRGKRVYAKFRTVKNISRGREGGREGVVNRDVKMWSMEILTISIKRWHPGNNVLSAERFTGRAEIPRTIRSQQIVFRTRPCTPSPLPRRYAVVQCFLQPYRKALCG